MSDASRTNDMMRCRSCGVEERASEGYPCANCGTFLCVMCSLKGLLYCAACASELGRTPAGAPAPPPSGAGTGP